MFKKRCGDGWVIPVYFLFALFYFWLAAQIPYTHDDWDWGLDIGMQQFLYATVNSRYVGNFFEIIMTRSAILKTVIMGSVFFWIPFLLSRLGIDARERQTASTRLQWFITGNVFLLTIHPTMWSETYGWVAGCANYMISAVFLMLWMRELLLVLSDTPPIGKDSWLTVLLYSVAALCGQLFLENVAIFCVLLAVALCVLYRKRYAFIPRRVAAMLCGALVGLLIMFSGRMYDSLLQNGSAVGDYREIAILGGGGIGHVVYRTAISVLNLGVRLYSLNPLLMITVSALLLWCCLAVPRERRSRRHSLWICIDAVMMVAFMGSGLYDRLCTSHAKWVYACDFILSVVFGLSVLLQVVSLFHGALRRKLVALWIAAPLVIAPLVVTTEAGCRLFFTSNLFILLFVLVLLSDVVRQSTSKTVVRMQVVGGVVAAVLLCVYGVIFYRIGACNQERLLRMETAVQEQAATISLPAFPFEEYLHFPDPNEEVRISYFAEFYGIPEDVEIIFESSAE